MTDTDFIQARLTLVTRWLARIAGMLVLLTALLVTGDVLARNMFRIAPFYSFEFGSLLFAMAVALGLPYALLSGANVRIDVLQRHVPEGIRRWLDCAALLSVAWLGGLLGWFSTRLMLSNAARDVRSGSDLNLALAWPQSVWAAGFIILGVTALILAWRHATLLIQGRTEEADRIAVAHDEGADALSDAAAMQRTS
ncbi:TRAP transporter small permease (plasmid) [Sulfitobacter sp. LCG007]